MNNPLRSGDCDLHGKTFAFSDKLVDGAAVENLVYDYVLDSHPELKRFWVLAWHQ